MITRVGFRHMPIFSFIALYNHNPPTLQTDRQTGRQTSRSQHILHVALKMDTAIVCLRERPTATEHIASPLRRFEPASEGKTQLG